MFTREQKREANQRLPEEVRDFVSSNEVMEIIESVAKKLQLDEVREDLLDSEVYYTALGLQTTDKMIVNLEKGLGIPESRVLEMMPELKDKIFNKLEELKKKSPVTAEKVSENVQKNIEIKSEPKLTPSDHLIETAEGNRDNVADLRSTTEAGSMSQGSRKTETATTASASANQEAAKQTPEAPITPIVPKVSSEEIERALQAAKGPQVQVNPEPAPAKSFGARLMEKAVRTPNIAPAPQESGAPSAQQWGTVVDQRLSAQSQPLKNESGGNANFARVTENPNTQQTGATQGEDPYRIKPE